MIATIAHAANARSVGRPFSDAALFDDGMPAMTDYQEKDKSIDITLVQSSSSIFSFSIYLSLLSLGRSKQGD